MTKDPLTPEISQQITAYSRVQSSYERFSQYVSELVAAHCGKDLIHTTEHRAKSLESLERKCRKSDEHGALRYKDPLNEVTDLAGVRVIVFVRDSVDQVCEMIEQIFAVLEKEDVGDRVYNQGKFGYQSKHLLIRLGDDRRFLVENSDFQNLVCEIQVRTLLQHAWAEMEHDIQYKSDQEIPLDLKKRFSALAGLLELADREFQSIQRDSETLRRSVKAELINDLTQQSLSGKAGSEGTASTDVDQSVAARNLVSQGRYGEAIDIYTAKINDEPVSHTLFVGRAKARFVNGDVKGAIADLDEVDRLRGDEVATERLRSIMEQGYDPKSAVRILKGDTKHTPRLRAAEDALAAGDGVRAFVEYTTLEAEGYSKAFSLFGKAVCCALERDAAGVESYLDSFEIRFGTAMAVNACALKYIVQLMKEGDLVEIQEMLDRSLSELPNFVLDISPVFPLFEGLEKKAWPEIELVRELRAKLQMQRADFGVAGRSKATT